ncbi:MAG: hypothetical protein LBP52_03085 [Burkholderiaceae bacterium]|jgi:hypothetical protein|nr:hypothetical protein [Burkholderiaceae bacterium]
MLDVVPVSSKVPGGAIRTLDPNRSDKQTVRITISPITSAEPYPKVTVEIDPTGTNTAANSVKIIYALELTQTLNGDPSGTNDVPAFFKLGFGAGAVGNPGIQEVRIIRARTLNALFVPVPTLEQNALGVLAVLLALLTLPALRSRFKKNVCGGNTSSP